MLADTREPLGMDVGSFVGRYEVVRLLGSGGMGRVWLVRHRDLGSLHALKRLLDDRPHVDDRLRREGRMQASTAHVNIVRVTDLVEVDGHPALVLEYVDGPRLDVFLAQHVPTIAEIDRLGRGILAGVADAHERGWVHRDLKPANVLLQVTADDLVPKIADFGLATVCDEGGDAATTTRAGAGTPGYMPLEQLTGGPPDPRMDVYALGVVLFEVACGRSPFASREAWAAAIRGGPVPVPDRADLPDRMRHTIQAALQPHELRPRTAGELLATWTDREGSLSGIRAEILADARNRSHLPSERLLAATLELPEIEHLETCVRCRHERRNALGFGVDAGTSVVHPPARRGFVAMGRIGALLVAGLAAPAPEPPTRAEPVTAQVARGEEPPPRPPPRSEPDGVLLPSTAPATAQTESASAAPATLGAKRPGPEGFLVVNTIGGPMGSFQVDSGPRMLAGALRRQALPSGRHRLRVYASNLAEPVFDDRISIPPREEYVFCWDLEAGSRCRE